MTELPDWVVFEVGRLYLHALALEQELDRREAQEDNQKLKERYVAAEGDPEAMCELLNERA